MPPETSAFETPMLQMLLVACNPVLQLMLLLLLQLLLLLLQCSEAC